MIVLIASCSKKRTYRIEVTYINDTKDTIAVPSSSFPKLNNSNHGWNGDKVIPELYINNDYNDVIAANVYKYKIISSN